MNEKEISKQMKYYRSHADEFVEQYLGIKLTLFQKFTLKSLYQKSRFGHLISRSCQQNRQLIEYAWMFHKCMLIPNFNIVIASDNSKIDCSIFNFIKQLSEQAQNEIAVAITNPDMYIKFNNGSTIRVVKSAVKHNKKLLGGVQSVSIDELQSKGGE